LCRLTFLAALLYLIIPGTLAADCNPYEFFCVPPITKATTVSALVDGVVNFLKVFAAAILVVVILVGALQIMVSSGNPENLKRGRQTITCALIGFAVILLAGNLGNIVAGILGVDPSELGMGSSNLDTPGGVIGVINTVAGWMYGILMALGTVFILLSAFFFLTSGGNADRVGTARRTLIYAIVALVIAVLAGSAKFLVGNLLDVEVPNTSDVSVDIKANGEDRLDVDHAGTPVSISWISNNAVECSTSCKSGGVQVGRTSTNLNGTIGITVDSRTTCTATCTNSYAANGENKDVVTINVKGPQ